MVTTPTLPAHYLDSRATEQIKVANQIEDPEKHKSCQNDSCLLFRPAGNTIYSVGHNKSSRYIPRSEKKPGKVTKYCINLYTTISQFSFRSKMSVPRLVSSGELRRGTGYGPDASSLFRAFCLKGFYFDVFSDYFFLFQFAVYWFGDE